MLEKNLVLDKGLLKRGYINGVFLEDFGIEFSDKFSFFTLTEHPRFVVVNTKEKINKKNYSRASYYIQTIEGNFKLDVSTKILKIRKIIKIQAELFSYDKINIQDFVIRMKFKKKNILSVRINNKILKYKNSHIYNQHKVNNIQINTLSKKNIIIERTKASNVLGSENHIYAKDQNNFWIIHDRIFPKKKPVKFNLRWITRYFWISLDENISKLISNFSILKNILWYRKERLGKKASEIQLIGLINLEKNSKIKQVIEIKY